MLVRHQDLFEADLPENWEFFADDQGGGAVSPDRRAVVHFHAERVLDMAEFPNLSRMLAGFLTQHQRPVATDELLRIKLPGALCFAWQYADVSEHRAVRVWIVGNEAAWVFVNFHSPLDQEPHWRAAIDQLIRSIRLTP